LYYVAKIGVVVVMSGGGVVAKIQELGAPKIQKSRICES
jgi:hypothetical protein